MLKQEELLKPNQASLSGQFSAPNFYLSVKELNKLTRKVYRTNNDKELSRMQLGGCSAIAPDKIKELSNYLSKCDFYRGIVFDRKKDYEFGLNNYFLTKIIYSPFNAVAVIGRKNRQTFKAPFRELTFALRRKSVIKFGENYIDALGQYLVNNYRALTKNLAVPTPYDKVIEYECNASGIMLDNSDGTTYADLLVNQTNGKFVVLPELIQSVENKNKQNNEQELLNKENCEQE